MSEMSEKSEVDNRHKMARQNTKHRSFRPRAFIAR